MFILTTERRNLLKTNFFLKWRLSEKKSIFTLKKKIVWMIKRNENRNNDFFQTLHNYIKKELTKLEMNLFSCFRVIEAINLKKSILRKTILKFCVAITARYLLLFLFI